MASSMNGRQKLLIVSEPLSGVNSVQSKFIYSFCQSMREKFDITVAAMKISEDVRQAYQGAGIRLISPARSFYSIDALAEKMDWGNESSLWAEAWFREAFLSQNSRRLKELVDIGDYDYVINSTNTIAIDCDVWWIQGVSTSKAINSIRFHKKWQQIAAKVAEIGLKEPSMDVLHKLFRKSRLRIANSCYLKEYFEKLGMPVHGVVHSFPDFSAFRKKTGSASDRYALSYVGKETEVDTLLRLADSSMKIVTFGQKKLPGLTSRSSMSKINFLGRVSHEQLISLYSSAQFTVFPFTNEPLGAVPMESMACGTPVLTYNKQGPSEIVINGETGWLAEDSDELVEIGNRIWKGFNREWFSANAVKRAALFTPKNQAAMMTEFLLG